MKKNTQKSSLESLNEQKFIHKHFFIKQFFDMRGSRTHSDISHHKRIIFFLPNFVGKIYK